MAGEKITNLTAATTVDHDNDQVVVVDTSDTAQATSGTTKKSTPKVLMGGKDLPIGDFVGTSDTQTLTNKTLTSPVVNTPTGIVKGDVGLGNVDNTSDATKNSSTATLTNKTIDGDNNTLQDIKSESLKVTIGCRVHLSANQSITNDAFVKVNFDTEDFDIGSDYDIANYRFVAPVTGYYYVTVAYEWDDIEDSTSCYASVYVNGSEYLTKRNISYSVNSDLGNDVSGLIYCESGQYIEAYAFNSGTVAKDIKTSNARSYMDIHLVGGV